MNHNPKFGPAAQTPEQRAFIVVQMQRMLPGLRKTAACAQQLYARYVAGELSWEEVRQARELAASSAPRSA